MLVKHSYIDRDNKKYVVSTVKLTSDVMILDNFIGNNPEKFEFESCVFLLDSDDDPILDPIYTERHSSLEEAREAHEKLAKEWYP